MREWIFVFYGWDVGNFIKQGMEKTGGGLQQKIKVWYFVLDLELFLFRR